MDSIIADSPRKAHTQLHEEYLLNVVVDLCRFILCEAVNVRVKYFYDAQELAMDSIYISLCGWENQEHRAGSSSASRK